MKGMRRLFCGALALAMVLGMTACGSSGTSSSGGSGAGSAAGSSGSGGQQAEMVLSLATDSPMEYPTTQALSYFGDKLAELTDGRIQVEIYPSTLGDEVSYLEQLQLGTVDLAKLSIGTINGLYTDLQVFNLPFLFKNGDEMWTVLESEVGDRILNGLNDYGLQGIGFTDNGSRCFYTTFPINSLDDFKNHTIRVQANNIMMSMIECLGANPVNVAANEMYSAVQTGVCDGGENNLNYILSESYCEVAPYVTLDNHTTGMDVICINLDLWNSLSEDDQTAVKQAMAEATAYDREIWNAAVEESIQGLKDQGAQVNELDDATLESFRDAVQPIYDEYSTSLADWIEAIDQALGK